jgi:hypothetical protein
MQPFKPFAFDAHIPAAWRVVLALFGVGVAALTTWELRAALLQPGWWTLFFGVILLGAWIVGGSALWAALMAESVSWRVEPGLISLYRRSPFRQVWEVIRARDIRAIEVAQSTLDPEDGKFHVAIHRKRGRVLRTPEHGTRDDAAATAARLRALLMGPVAA